MSCRAFSRHIEYRCLEYLFESLQISEVHLDFQPTEEMARLQEFLSKFVDAELSSPVRIQRASFHGAKASAGT